MSSLFKDLSYTPTQSLYVQKPVDDFVKSAMIMQQNYNTALEGSYKLQEVMSNIKSREPNNSLLQSELAKYEQTLKEVAAKGDYEHYGSKIKRLGLDFSTNKNIKDITEDYLNFQNFIKEAQEGVKSGDLSSADFKRAYNFYAGTYNKPIERDPITNEVKNKFPSYIDIPKNVNIEEDIQKLAKDLEKGLVSDEFIKKYNLNSLPGYYAKYTGKDPEVLAGIARQYILGNEDITNLLSWRADMDSKSFRMQNNGQLRDYTLKDLYDLGITGLDGQIYKLNDKGEKVVDEEASKKLYVNGILNQVLADKLVKSILITNNITNYEDFARTFGTIDVDYKEDIIARDNRKFNRDVALETLKAQTAKEISHIKAKRDNEAYYEPFTINKGEAKTLDEKVAPSYLGESAYLGDAALELVDKDFNLKTKNGDYDLNTSAILSDYKEKYYEAVKAKKEIEVLNEARKSQSGKVAEQTDNKLSFLYKRNTELVDYLNSVRTQLNTQFGSNISSNKTFFNTYIAGKHLESTSNEVRKLKEFLNKNNLEVPIRIKNSDDSSKNFRRIGNKYYADVTFELTKNMVANMDDDLKKKLMKNNKLIEKTTTKVVNRQDIKTTTFYLSLPKEVKPNVQGNLYYNNQNKLSVNNSAIEESYSEFLNNLNGVDAITKLVIAYKESNPQLTTEQLTNHINSIFNAVNSGKATKEQIEDYKQFQQVLQGN